MDHCEHTHNLGLCIQIILLWDGEYLEVPLHHAKNLLNHIPELCMSEIKELFVILGPEGDRWECTQAGIAIHTFQMPVPILWDDIECLCKELRVCHSLGIQCWLDNTGPLEWWSHQHAHHWICDYLQHCSPIQEGHRQTSCPLLLQQAHFEKYPPSSSDKQCTILLRLAHAPEYASHLSHRCNPWTKGRSPCCL